MESFWTCFKCSEFHCHRFSIYCKRALKGIPCVFKGQSVKNNNNILLYKNTSKNYFKVSLQEIKSVLIHVSATAVNC